ncbi:putative signal transducing protein [Oligoflexus tunisiensis]|uniref:putative signal transducing protein n=1 Tax=Oligoflexus tunisiensis TaxID=708132 RepID=UPI00159EF9FB|nr:DUF2007 domain-containing protein [Oligoflexus tunisiensis]
MITLFETFDVIQADILRAQLEELGIKAHVYSADLHGLSPSLAFVTPIKVLVPEPQLVEAQRVLKDLGF